METTIHTYSRLQCSECPSLYFVRVIHLKWQPGGGLVEEPAGYRCGQCNAEIDAAQLIARKQMQLKQQELKALQEELKDAAAGGALQSRDDQNREEGAAGVSGEGHGRRSQKP